MNPFRPSTSRRLLARPGSRRRSALPLLALAAAGVVAATLAVPAAAQAKSDFCAGGGFQLVLPGRTVTARPGQDLRTTIPANQLGTSFLVKGRYVEFTVSPASLGVTGWTFTGAANPGDLTGGKRTPVFASKTPDLRGATLTGGMEIPRVAATNAAPRGSGEPGPRSCSQPVTRPTTTVVPSTATQPRTATAVASERIWCRAGLRGVERHHRSSHPLRIAAPTTVLAHCAHR